MMSISTPRAVTMFHLFGSAKRGARGAKRKLARLDSGHTLLIADHAENGRWRVHCAVRPIRIPRRLFVPSPRMEARELGVGPCEKQPHIRSRGSGWSAGKTGSNR